MGLSKDEPLQSREILLYATAVVWANRRIQRHIDQASIETTKRLKQNKIRVHSF